MMTSLLAISCLGLILEDIACAAHKSTLAFLALGDLLIYCRQKYLGTSDKKEQQRTENLALFIIHAMR